MRDQGGPPWTVGGGRYGHRVPDPTAYLATMAGASATLVAIIGGLSVSKFVGLDAEQQMTKRQFDEADTKAKTVAYQLRLAEQRHEDHVLSKLAANGKALTAIYKGVTDYELLRYDCGLPKVGGELASRLMGRAQEALSQARAYFADVFPQTPTALAVEDWCEPPSWAEVVEGESMTDLGWAAFWQHGYYAYVRDRKEQQLRERRDQRRGFALNPELLADQERILSERAAMLANAMPKLPAALLNADLGSRMVGPLVTPADRLWDDVCSKRDENREAQTELLRVRKQWERSISPDGRQLVGGLFALLFPTVLGVVLPVVALSMGPDRFTTPLLLISYGFYVGLIVLFGYMFYLARRLMLGHESRMERLRLPFLTVRRLVGVAASRLHFRRAR